MGDCAKGGGRAPKAQTPRCVGSGMNCAVLTALPAYSLRERPTASLRAAQIIRRSFGPFPRFTKRARGTVTLRADLRPAEVSWTFAQPPRELRGGFVSAKLVGAASLALAPAQSARCLGRREKGVPFLLGAAPALR